MSKDFDVILSCLDACICCFPVPHHLANLLSFISIGVKQSLLQPDLPSSMSPQGHLPPQAPQHPCLTEGTKLLALAGGWI